MLLLFLSSLPHYQAEYLVYRKWPIVPSGTGSSRSNPESSREYDNIHCPSLCWNDLSSRAPHKSSPFSENFKITFNLVLGHIRSVLMLVLHFAKSRDVTSLLKWVYAVLDDPGLDLHEPVPGGTKHMGILSAHASDEME